MTGILALETATDACSVAVYAAGETRERHRVAPRRHGELLFALLQDLLPGGDLRGRGIEAIAYGSGPGSFTGLRIAASVAQGLAYSSQLPAVAVPTLAILAQSALAGGRVTDRCTVLSVLDARVNEVYAAVYAFEAGLAVLREGPWACAPDELSPVTGTGLDAVGNGCRYLDAAPPALRERLKSRAADVLPRAGDMIPLAQALIARGELLSPRDILPVYVRDEIHWKKVSEQGRGVMIDLFQAVMLALVQGLTEFLPISSSAHLLIPSLVLGWPDQGLAFDVAVHVGTLAAVVLYYRADLLRMADSWLRSLAGAPACDDSRMVWYIAIATVPAGLVGLLGGDYIESELRVLPVIATTTLLFGILLGMADRRARDRRGGKSLGLAQALIIGFAQALAPVPGVSRSGITMTAALFAGMSRQAGARFSFLLSIPIIASAGLLKVLELLAAEQPVDWMQLAVGVAVSGVTAYCCIAAFLRLIDRVGFMPFVYYRVALAGLLYLIWLAGAGG